jgi:hypothetical protein
MASYFDSKYNGRGEKFRFCTYDKNMLKIAKELGFETNGV